MNLLTRIKAAFDSRRWVRSSMQVISGDDSKRQPFSYSTAVRYYSSWIYAAATINAVTVAAQPLRLYVRRRGNGAKLWGSRPVSRRAKAYLAGDAAQLPSRTVLQKVAEYGDDYEVVTERHPILDLLSSMNPYSNGFDATVLRILYGELTGNAYLHPIIDRRLGVPVELWTMPSQWVEIVPGKEGEQFIRGYRYGTTTEQRAANFYEPDEVIHFRRPNPNDLYYGIGKVEAAWGAAMQNAAVHEMDLSFFENKARPDYLLTVKGDAHPDELERLEAAIDQKLRGKSRTGRFLASTAEIDVKPLGFPPKDLQGRDEIVEEIAAVFGVPVSMLKANDPNLASATTGYAMWRETTILPLLRMDEETLNQNLLPLFDVGEDAFLAYDNPVKADERFEFEKMRGLVAGGIITANEARQMEGLEPVADDENANRLLINGQPLGGTPQAAIPFGASTDDRQVLDSGSPDQLVGPLDPAADREEPPEAKAIESKDALSDCVSEKIPLLIDEGYPQDQAVAIAYSMCSEGKSIEEAARANTKAVADVDTKPPQSVADNARRALEVRETKPMSERGMTAVGIARARDLANRAELSEDTIRRMVAYFERHQSDKQGSTWDEQGKGWQAWNGWGGDEGWAWAKRKVEEFDRARGEKSACGCGCGLKRTLSQKALWAESVIGKASERDAAREQREIREDEKEIADKVSKVLDEQVRAVIAEIRRATVPSRDLLVRVEKLLAANRWNTRVTDALRPYLRAALEAGADLGVSTVSKQVAAAGAGVPGEPPSAADMFGVAKDDLRAYAQSESVRLARRAATAVNQYTSVRVAEIVGQTIAEGASIADIADRVQEWAGEKGDADRLVRNRAVTIARTEANRATRVAEVEAWKATGAVVGKTWLLAPDPCEFCEAASKAFSENPVGLDRPFYEKGAVLEGADGGSLALDYEAIEGPPLHPNCRCSLQPQLRDDLEDIVREIAESGDVDRARQEIYESDMRSNP